MKPSTASRGIKVGGSDDDNKDPERTNRAGRISLEVVYGAQLAQSDRGYRLGVQPIGAQGTLDYLFVDEAGQVSAANLLGMAPSTRNIILIGDQMQLSQPTKGSHPGEAANRLSSISCRATLQFQMIWGFFGRNMAYAPRGLPIHFRCGI